MILLAKRLQDLVEQILPETSHGFSFSLATIGGQEARKRLCLGDDGGLQAIDGGLGAHLDIAVSRRLPCPRHARIHSPRASDLLRLLSLLSLLVEVALAGWVTGLGPSLHLEQRMQL